jgi:acetyl-CoA C-acetyltransferase
MTSERDVVIVSVARTPFGKFGGALRALSAVELAGLTIAEAVRRSGVDAEAVDSLYAGVGMIGANVLTSTRQALLLGSGLPHGVPSLTVDRACCSGMTALGLGFREIRSGEAQVVVAGGFESLSNTPYLTPRRHSSRPGNVLSADPLLLRAEFLDKAIARYTGEEAEKLGIGRARQDEWACDSHRKYFEAEGSGYFEFERFPVAAGDGEVVSDEGPRADISAQRLAELSTVYDSPTVTPGNAPGLNDGAAFAVLASRSFARAHGLPVLATISDYVQVADGPTTGSRTPALAIERLLERSGRNIAGVDVLEINEAFAATPLVSTWLLAGQDAKRTEALRSRTNVAGGAVAIGHPLGASGCRIVMTALNSLRRRGGGYAAAAICGGFGQGDSLLLSAG